ncbi:PREDICTED: rab GTPase-binding effector protein 1 isoform X1 [Papilio xuthus]|uniref:Rab GTPase-binding effector protein 1 isoform X1 n=1 Tax=Papilio xuthus TaxID=66420 RepID=A0AAJ6ZDU5_PAPXU|nr:PREDICTED: rab GTPase-binding effector protein 1 isoform X1 [Papilio xuthus]
MNDQSKMSGETTVAVEDGGGGPPSPDTLRRDLEEEFNIQRAKMKELFLQKEEDMRKMVIEREQLQSEVLSLRAALQQLQTLSHNQKSEIQSLQLLVSETVEASSSGTEEVRRLRARTLDLEHQLRQQQQAELSLAPATFVRSLARKLGADTDTEHPQRKQNIEDNELLNSIIQPLELEISALKNKLRETDAQLQEALKAKAAPASAASSTGSGGDAKQDTETLRRCDMCANYERQLVSEQGRADAARDKANQLEQALKLATEELEGVRSLHEETLVAAAGWRAEGGARLGALAERLAAATAALEERQAAAAAAEQRALHTVTTLTVDRETLQRKLDALERDNAMLVGQYTKKAEEMQNEIIDLPDNVEELQEQQLRLREQLIVCEVGREEAVAAERDLRAQLLHHGALFHRQEEALAATREQLKAAKEELDRLQTEREQMQQLADKLRHSNDMIEQLLEDKKRLQNEACEVRGRVHALQLELDNSEKVQQDFVRLSQSLQVQLERIREADTEVRWQHDEDVSECPACHTALPNNKKKVHCRHCGRIFCGACVSHCVASGPRGAPARVCGVCRTLLQPHAAPYFSTDPPQ